MGVFSNNRTTLGNDIDIPVAEGYKSAVAADVMLVEAVQTDMSLFEAMLGNDFAEVAALKEGTVLESEMQAITEGALQSMVAKVKELLKKIIAKLKALFATFMAKFQNVVIRDNKKFVDSIKKDLYNGKNYDKMEYKWREPHLEDAFGKATSEIESGLDTDKDYEGGKEEELKAALQEIESGNLVEELLGEIIGVDKALSLADFNEEFDKACFGEEIEKVGASADIKAAVDFLSANPKSVKKISEANKKVEAKYKSKLKTWEAKANKLSSKEGSEKEEERVEYLYASLVSKLYNGMYSAAVSAHKAMVAAVKFETKQYRQLLVKAVAYTPVKEDAMLMIEAANAEEYEVDMLFNDSDCGEDEE